MISILPISFTLVSRPSGGSAVHDSIVPLDGRFFLSFLKMSDQRIAAGCNLSRRNVLFIGYEIKIPPLSQKAREGRGTRFCGFSLRCKVLDMMRKGGLRCRSCLTRGRIGFGAFMVRR